MKKIIAVTMVALMMFAVATSAFALLPESSASYKNPPVFIDGLVVSDAWMSGLTAQNWKAALTNQAYAEGSYIWFIAKIGVAASGDTDARHLWETDSQTATLTFTSKDNCLNFTSANMATLSRISGMSVDAQSIQNNNLSLVEATENKAKFTFMSQHPFGMDANRVLLYTSNLSTLRLDSIYGANAWDAAAVPTNAIVWNNGTAVNGNRATLQKDFYLHFMAITKAATEGVCIGTLKVNGEDEFTRASGGTTASPLVLTGRDGVTVLTGDEEGMHPGSYTTAGLWGSGTTAGGFSSTKLLSGDRSIIYLLFNTVNGKQYSIMKIANEAIGQDKALAIQGPFTGEGHIYVLMDVEAENVICGFVVANGAFMGLAKWNKDRAGNGTFFVDGNGRDAANYLPVSSNDLSSAIVALVSAYNGYGMTTGELQAIFDFFGFAYGNPRAPGDADFLARSGLVTVAEAKYNVANAVITTPDTSIVIPKTGDAATSTGLILVASAILAAAAVGFVLSKRAHN